MISHIISHVYDILGPVYDILCYFICFLVPSRASSNAAPGLPSKACSDAPGFKSNTAAARPVRLAVFFGLEIRLQWFTDPY